MENKPTKHPLQVIYDMHKCDHFGITETIISYCPLAFEIYDNNRDCDCCKQCRRDCAMEV